MNSQQGRLALRGIMLSRNIVKINQRAHPQVVGVVLEVWRGIPMSRGMKLSGYTAGNGISAVSEDRHYVSKQRDILTGTV